MTATTPTTEAAMDTERKVYVIGVMAEAAESLDWVTRTKHADMDEVASELRAAITAVAKLIESVEAYESECANPVMDPVLKRRRRQEMFTALSRLGASA